MAKLDLHSTAGLVRYATTSSSPEYGSGAGGWGEGWGPRPRAGSVSAFRPGTWETSDCYLTTSPAAPLFFRYDIAVVLWERDLMPGTTWVDLLESIKHLPNPPSLIVTPRLAGEYLWAEALNLGAWDVPAKPFDRSEVVRTTLRNRRGATGAAGSDACPGLRPDLISMARRGHREFGIGTKWPWVGSGHGSVACLRSVSAFLRTYEVLLAVCELTEVTRVLRSAWRHWHDQHEASIQSHTSGNELTSWTPNLE